VVNELIADALMLGGASFLLLAAVGIVRMPDLFTRMQTATKASTLGISLILLAAGLLVDDYAVALRAILTISFFFVTAPVAAHMIGRAAYFVRVPLWSGTITDELSGHYDRATHRLSADAVSARTTEAPESIPDPASERSGPSS
jgi:multicomponent Na+:H+ antiporter subunit G